MKLIAITTLAAAMLIITATANGQETETTPTAYQACGHTVYEGEDGTRQFLLRCVRGLKERVNDHRHHAHQRGWRPFLTSRSNPELAGYTEKWARIHLVEARKDHRLHRAWHRAHEYSNATHYGVPWPVIVNFTCIHRWEGSWRDPNSPYYGGLQMDWSFMDAYGYYHGRLPNGERVHWDFVRRWGSADHWPVWAQFVAANHARAAGRGYHPWPLTARRCGLI